ncbi:Kelch repeat-containing protein [Melittangium boletus]|uniref:Kelch repeat-containing protein n=1 Tax=Melittangium boletus TaxID=83453 RepID=UPI003DA5CD3A
MNMRWSESWWARMLALLVVVGAPAARAQESGCADGQREGFVDSSRYPNIAGCSGGWSIPGVLVSTPGFEPYCSQQPMNDTLTPACARGAGDDGSNPSGAGCNVADLCAPGWHVCANEPEVATNSPTGCSGATRAGDPALFFATRQSGTGYGVCASGTGTGPECNSSTGAYGCLQTTRTGNDLFGCGNLGAAPATTCGVLNRFSNNTCMDLGSPWDCGGAPAEYCETQAVKKPSPGRGGVLCCRDNVNRAPVTRCQDVTVDSDATCQGCGSVNAGSYDPDFDRITCEQTPSCPLKEGANSVTLTCTDARGASSSCTATVRVTPRGTCTPPREGWVPTGRMAQGRILHQAVLLDSGKVLVAGGFSPMTELYDPAAGTWSRTGDALASHRDHSMTKLADGQVLIAGGGTCPITGATAELYVPASGRWKPTGSLLTNRTHHAAVRLASGRVLVVGGEHSATGALLASAELYDPATGTWSATGSLGTAREDATATLLPSGRVLVVGGMGAGGFLRSAELYDPATGTWSATAALGAPRRLHTATLLPTGRVLVIGGGQDLAASASAELYDPTSGTWSATDAMKTPRRAHSATLLPSGQVLVAGGYNDASGILTASEVYTPATQRWSDTAPLNVDRYGHTATALSDGRVLAAGGVSNRDQASAEWFGRASP